MLKQPNSTDKAYTLKRRGFDLGACPTSNAQGDSAADWHSGKPILLKGISELDIAQYANHIAQSDHLYATILGNQECDRTLSETPYRQRLQDSFESLGSSINQGDDQEIETIIFDAIDNTNNSSDVVAEDLWIKISWLSFYEEDASLRFRFSFGVDLVEDVAADKHRQHYAAQLTDAIFPESRLVTQNDQLHKVLLEILNCDNIKFVERIIYFNSPQGGAYLHHDRERGHAGVVYLQLSGATFWLALPKQQLIDEIATFVNNCRRNRTWPVTIDSEMQLELLRCISSNQTLAEELESFCNTTLIHLINETESFVQQLISNGHGRLITAGDALLLPQETDLSCCWHSVFSLGDESGEALSFAIRTD